MKLLSALALTAVALQQAAAFSPAVHNTVSQQRRCSPLAAIVGGVDVEALLAKAKKLKAEAAAAEQQLHMNRLNKKDIKEHDLDYRIEMLFPLNDDSITGLVSRVKESHSSTEKLMQITARLHEREIYAQGKGHVSASLDSDSTTFKTVSEENPVELARVQGLIDRLMEAAEVIDEEYMSEKRKQKDTKHLNHNDQDHWTMGELAGHLHRQVGELRREHEKQFQDRMESFNEAQRRNKTGIGKKDETKK